MPKHPKSPAHPSFAPCLEIWFQFYQQKNRTNYIMTPKCGMHLKQLLKKIETKLIERSMEPTPENVNNSFKGLLYSIKDQWTLDNLEIAIVNSKMNAIYSKALNGNAFNVASRIDDLVDLRANIKRATG